MGTFDLYDDDRKALPEEFLQGMDYSSKFLEGLERPVHETKNEKTNDIHSLEEAEQALTDTLSFLATDGSRQMDSSTVALLVKTLSDTRTLMTSGALMRDENNDTTQQIAEDKDDEKDHSDKNTEKKICTTTTSQNNDNNTSPVLSEEDNIREILGRIEQHIDWPARQIDLDKYQKLYLSELQKAVRNYSSINDLLRFCREYAECRKGRFSPDMFVFILIVYFSDIPEMYISLFLLNPVDYFESPLTHKKIFEYDTFISHTKKI